MNRLDNHGLHLSVTHMSIKYSMIFLRERLLEEYKKDTQNSTLCLVHKYNHKSLRKWSKRSRSRRMEISIC
jgi:hypothetical protein